MKSITKLLEKSNLTPRECIMLLIRHQAHRNTTGEEILTEADVRSLSDGWRARNNHDVREYNKYWYMWDHFKNLEINIQTLFLVLQIDINRLEKLLIFYLHDDDMVAHKNMMENKSLHDEDESSLVHVLKNTGIEYDVVIHTYTFLSLPKKQQEILESLDESVKTDRNYLNEEEQIARIIEGKKKLDQKDIDALTNLIMDAVPWDRDEHIRKRNINMVSTIFSGYYACCDMMDFAIQIADEYDISFTDEKDLRKQLSKYQDIKSMLRKAIHTSIEDGLFFNQCVPLCNDPEYAKTMKSWMRAKEKTIQEIQSLIDKGELILKERTDPVYGKKRKKLVVTGESLYYADESLPFVKEFKEQVHTLKIHGYLFKLIQRKDIFLKYAHILAFKDIADRVSDIVGEKITDSPERYIKEIQEMIDQLNRYLRGISCNIENSVFLDLKYDFYIETYFEELQMGLENIKPIENDGLKGFSEKTGCLLGQEWKREDEPLP